MPTTSIAQFFVVVRDAASLELQQVPVTAALQDDLSSEFMDQMSNLLADKRQITFSPSYQPDADELFIIQRYALPSFLQHAVTSPDHFPELQLPFTPNGPIVKAILVAFPPGRGGRPQYLFQHFDRRRILNTQRTLIFRGGEFSRLEDPGVVIGDHLDAVIQGEDLIFWGRAGKQSRS